MWNKKNLCQQAFGKIANFVVKSRFPFARKLCFNRKYAVPKFATSPSAGTLAEILAQNQESNAILRQKNNLKLYYVNNLQKTKSKP